VLTARFESSFRGAHAGVNLCIPIYRAVPKDADSGGDTVFVDPGRPITREDIVEGEIPGKNGFMPPAEQIK
jgi:hypothetical protein